MTYRFGGSLVINDCPLPRRRVTLLKREGPGEFTSAGHASTDSRGRYGLAVRLPRSADLRVVFAGDRHFARAVSRVIHVSVWGDPPTEHNMYAAPPSNEYTAPEGVTIEMVVLRREVARGSDLKGYLKVRNDSTAFFTFTDSYNTDRWGLLQNPRNGEVPNHMWFSDNGAGRYGESHTVPPKLFILLPVTIRTRTCQGGEVGPAIQPGVFAAHTSLLLYGDDDGRSVMRAWTAPPVHVTVV